MILSTNTMIVVPKINTLFFFVKLPKAEVIFDFSVSLTLISLLEENIESNEGNSKKVTDIETVKPNVIIHPKSIIGLIPLKINDRKAQIVVKTVYKIGKNIFLLVSNTASALDN